MAGLWSWIGAEWRRSWRALTALTLIVAFGGAITIAAIAGARRADGAFDEFLDQTSAPLDVSIAGSDVDLSNMSGASSLAADMAKIPGVDGVTPVVWMGVGAAANGVTTSPFSTAWLPGVGSS